MRPQGWHGPRRRAKVRWCGMDAGACNGELCSSATCRHQTQTGALPSRTKTRRARTCGFAVTMFTRLRGSARAQAPPRAPWPAPCPVPCDSRAPRLAPNVRCPRPLHARGGWVRRRMGAPRRRACLRRIARRGSGRSMWRLAADGWRPRAIAAVHTSGLTNPAVAASRVLIRSALYVGCRAHVCVCVRARVRVRVFLCACNHSLRDRTPAAHARAACAPTQ